jgi:acyl-ACP thioesterase
MTAAAGDMSSDQGERPVPRPPSGRTYTGTRRARFGDLSPGGRLRLDAIARYLQDVSSDDTTDAGLADDVAWVVRRLVLEVEASPRFREPLELTTWCSGTGSRWAERRVSIAGADGARIEAAVLWVHVDVDSGRPIPLDQDFWDLYAEAAQGRTVRVRLGHPTVVAADARRVPWTVRFADFDLLGHVNNAVYGAMVEEVLATRPDLRPPFRVEIEYRAAIERGRAVELVVHDEADRVLMWARDPDDGTLVATALVRRR